MCKTTSWNLYQIGVYIISPELVHENGKDIFSEGVQFRWEIQVLKTLFLHILPLKTKDGHIVMQFL